MDGAGPGATYQVITVKPYSPAIGAEIGNIDLTRPLTDLELSEIRRAFTDYMVLFFRQLKVLHYLFPTLDRWMKAFLQPICRRVCCWLQNF